MSVAWSRPMRRPLPHSQWAPPCDFRPRVALHEPSLDGDAESNYRRTALCAFPDLAPALRTPDSAPSPFAIDFQVALTRAGG